MPAPRSAFATLLILGLAACGAPADKAGTSTSGGASPAAAAGELTPFQLQHGIGPITTEMTLGAPDKALAGTGEKIFETKCSACHKLREKYVGPPLAGIVQKVGPTFVMNMILNPEGMYSKHPDVKKLLGEYMTQMPNQQLTQDEARAVVEYLRSHDA